MKPNLSFKLSGGKKKSFIDRYYARKVALMIFSSGKEFFRFGGIVSNGMIKILCNNINIPPDRYEVIPADKFQLMYAILSEAGYDCTTARIMFRCGVDPRQFEYQLT